MINSDLNKGMGLSLRDEKERLQNDSALAKDTLVNRFLEHFSSNRLTVQGYIGKQTPEKITRNQLRDMVEGKQLDIENSSGKLGKTDITSIRVKKADNVTLQQANENYLNPRVKETLLKIIIAMAVKTHRYNPKKAKNSATTKIKLALEEFDLTLDEDTILKYLKEAESLISPEVWTAIYPE